MVSIQHYWSSTPVITAVLGIAIAAVFASVPRQAKEEAQMAAVVHQPLAKADRLPVRTRGAACSSRSWPDYDQDCVFDLRSPAHTARTIRVVALR